MLFINIAGLALIGLIVWWFWLYKSAQIDFGKQDLIIVVENGIYSPAHIKVPAGKAIELKIMRKDPSPCAETFVLPALHMSETLPLNKLKVLQLPAMDAGEYDFHCQMQMYRGKMIAQ